MVRVLRDFLASSIGVSGLPNSGEVFEGRLIGA